MARAAKQMSPLSPSEADGSAEAGDEREKGSPPVYSKRAWTGSANVEVAVFERMIDGENGERRVFSIAAKRTWKDGEEYKNSNVFRPEDLLPLAFFLQLAYAFITNESSKK